MPLRNKIAAVALLTVVAISIESAQAQHHKNYSIESGNWSGGAFAKNDSFTHCSISGRYRSGISMYFSVGKAWNWVIGWSSDDWDLRGRSAVAITYWIDGYARRRTEAAVMDKNFAVAVLPDSSAVFDEFRKGYVLTVEAEGRQYKFNLEGTYVALTKLINCVSDNTSVAAGRSDSSTPREGKPTQKQEPSPDREWPRANAERKIEAIKVVANILAQNDMSGAKILSASEVKAIAPLGQDFDVVWKSGSTIGMLRVIPRSTGATIDDVSAALIAADSKSCKGEFASGSKRDEHSSEAKRAFAICKTALASVAANYTILPMDGGEIYLFGNLTLFTGGDSSVSATETDKAAANDIAFRNALYAVTKR